MENKSLMVVATKYKLLAPESILQGTFKKDGPKEMVHKKTVLRKFVEDRNSHNNNELYIIDEEATAEMLILREKNIVENVAKKKREKTSTSDLVEAIHLLVPKDASAPVSQPVATANDITGHNGTLFVDMTEGELRQYSVDNGIEQHHKAKEKGLIKVINDHNSKK